MLTLSGLRLTLSHFTYQLIKCFFTYHLINCLNNAYRFLGFLMDNSYTHLVKFCLVKPKSLLSTKVQLYILIAKRGSDMTERTQNSVKTSLRNSESAKHYTSKELTGLTKEEEKELLILYAIQSYYSTHRTTESEELEKQGKCGVAVKRYDARLKIIGEAFGKMLDPRVVSKYIDTCLIKGYFIQNSTSHLIKINERESIILPHNDTRYWIDIQVVNDEGNRLTAIKNKKGNNACVVSTLTKYLQNNETKNLLNNLDTTLKQNT